MTQPASKRLVTEASGRAQFAWQGQGLRPLRAACIGTSIYASGLTTADNKVVDVTTSPAWDATKMDRYMQGHGSKSWFTWMCLLSNGRILPHYNAAESGSTLTQQAARFQSQVIPKRPDVVFLGDATNDINTAVTDATIQGLITQQVGWALAANITPIIVATTRRGDDATKNTRVRNHNEWLRRYAWANGYAFIDPFAALVDPASTNGYPIASLLADGVLHPNEAGGKLAGQRALDDLAGLIPGNADPSKAKFIVQDRAASPNLFLNPLFQDDVNSDGIADNWTVSGTKSIVTDSRVVGKMQVSDITASGQGIGKDITVDGTNVSVGDRLAFSGLLEVSASANAMQWGVYLMAVGQATTWASNPIGYGGSGGGGPVGADLPLTAFYCELTVPTGATIMRAKAQSFVGGTGTIKAAQWRLVNLTKLGVDTLF